MIRDSGTPSTHSLTSTCFVPPTTPGTTKSGSSSYAAAKAAWLSASSS